MQLLSFIGLPVQDMWGTYHSGPQMYLEEKEKKRGRNLLLLAVKGAYALT